ncbi:unnamed protein product [Rhizoctonia solani]|uniref:CHAT domain-containing protein n=1 Tax=Rhizoctonia solani TaxID=456999 RepID=A0A8H3GU68_9AGAM|nr:unnamed protein product [Rhizoctonia solani]
MPLVQEHLYPTGVGLISLLFDRDQMDYYHDRFHQTGDISDLDKDIEYKCLGLSLYPDEDPCLFGHLGQSYLCRFRQKGSPSDLEHCIEHTTVAVSLVPSQHRHMCEWLTTLSKCHHERFQRSDRAIDLDKDIEYKSKAVSLKPEGDPNLLSALGHSYRVRFGRFGNTDDLDKAIEHGQLAISIATNEDPKLPYWLNQLGLTYHERFLRRGDPSDLDMEVDCITRAISLVSEHQGDLPRDLPQQLLILSEAYCRRYNRFGYSNDLQNAMECNARVLSLIEPASYSYQIRALTNLSILCLLRFEKFGNPNDIEKGIEYNARAYSLTSDEHAEEPFRLNNLSSLYYARFEHLDDLSDLEQAIEYSALAVSLTADSNGDLAGQLDKLGYYIHARWHRLGHPSDLHRDIVHKERAVSLTPEYHPQLPSRLENLGRSYWGRLTLLKCRYHFRQTQRLALDCFRRSCLSEVGNPEIRLKSARMWAQSARDSESTTEECLDAYQAAINLIPHVAWLGTTVVQRYQSLGKLSDLASEAASIAIAAQDYRRALEWLEQGRSIVMNQSLMLRSPLDCLRSVNPSLAEHFQKVADELHANGSQPQNCYSKAPGPSLEEIALRNRKLAKEHADLLSQVRQIPGFENFLKPKQADELVSAARTGPVVVVNIYEPRGRCDALILRPGTTDIAHVELPNFTSQTAANVRSVFSSSIVRGDLAERGVRKKPIQDQEPSFEDVLTVLWNTIVKPVLDYLEYKPRTSLEELPHVTWCTTGALSLLPLHAAGLYRTSGACASDYIVSSYAPNLTALISSTPLPTATSILAVSQEMTPGQHCHLPGTVQELASIESYAKGILTYAQLTNKEATIETVLNMMEKYDCIHLACHAHQSFKDPTKSGFFLHDGTLDLVSVMQRSFKNKGLAFLSACQTAMGDEALPDETVHLASSMLTAGYPSVIATMWSVWDKDAPFVSDRVYDVLLKDGRMDCRESAKALHYAVAELRKKIGNNQFARWVPFIHIGL